MPQKMMNPTSLLRLAQYVVWFMVSVWMMLMMMMCNAQEQENPMTMNGGSILAMAGKECVALAVDKRFGRGSALVNIAPRPILSDPINPYLVVVAFAGFEGDIQSLKYDLEAQIAHRYHRGMAFASSSFDQMHQARNPLGVSPQAMAFLTSHVLYSRKREPYYVEPLVVGLEEMIQQSDGYSKEIQAEGTTRQGTTKVIINSIDTHQRKYRIKYRPFLCSLDMIGAQSRSESFVCSGAASSSLYGTAEALWRPNLEPHQLLDVCATAFLSALERDCLSGYGAIIYMLTADGIVEYDLESRND